MKRRFLFLQGVCSPFFSSLGRALSEGGHTVTKVNFNAGDSWYWNNGNKITYRRSADELPDLYRNLLDDQGHTDIVLFGDHRPVHRPAIELARSLGTRIHVFEEGYFRPYWITLERDGVNALSKLPRDPGWYRRASSNIPDYGNGTPFKSSFLVRAWHDVVYHSAGLRNPICYPGYRNHAPVTAPKEYSSYIFRSMAMRRAHKRDTQAIQTLIYSRAPFWLLPLQLNSDAQIVEHSPFRSMDHMLEKVLSSFARMCRPDSTLVIKNHPLDTGLVDYQKLIAMHCEHLGLPLHRVLYLESGPLPALLNYARGVVTVNSTVGGSALVHGRPLIALGKAIYDMPGLTFQGHLDDFWRYTRRPDASLFRAFRNTVIHTTQINGGFYSKPSIEMSVRHAIPQLLSKRSRLEHLLSQHDTINRR